MTTPELPEALLAKADEVFEGLTEQEAGCLRQVAHGCTYVEIAELEGCSVSSIKSTVQRVVRKKAQPIDRLVYLVGVHDARAHDRFTGKDTVTVVVSRAGVIKSLDI